MSVPALAGTLGILLIDGGYDRAQYGFMLAAGAAAIGRKVVIFATNQACHALARDPAALAGFAAGDTARRRLGVADLATLREACGDLGVRMIACDAGMRVAGLEAAALLPGVEVSGIVTFLTATATGQLISL
jgi:peroxiredoxin family protein